MSVKIVLPTALARHTDGQKAFDSEAKDLPGLIAEFDANRRFSLIDMVHLQDRLADLLGVPVDLSSAKALKEPVRQKAAREAVLAF